MDGIVYDLRLGTGGVLGRMWLSLCGAVSCDIIVMSGVYCRGEIES